MARTPIHETLKNGRGRIQVRIDADRRQLERALRQLTEGWPVEVAVVRTHGDIETYTRRLPVLERGGNRVRYLKVEEIDWIEAERQYVRLHVRAKTFLVRGPSMTMKNLASRLDAECFLRVHRSHIVNLERIEALRMDAPAKRYAVLVGGRERTGQPGSLEAAGGRPGRRRMGVTTFESALRDLAITHG